MVERDARPDAILFADTGGEKPETYEYVAMMSAWLVRHGFPAITTVANDGLYGTLERNCVEKNMLPSIAYGFKSCSDKYKQRPQHKWCRSWQPCLECWSAGGKVVKLIGIHAAEVRRASHLEDRFYRYCYPLIEWNWLQRDCESAIRRMGLPMPLKSACFFCPSSKRSEIAWLAAKHPDLMQRALAMEDAAQPNLDTVKGLGRGFSWRSLALPMASEPTEPIECVCLGNYDYADETDDMPLFSGLSD
jgi:hypothetical protein